MTAKEIKKLKVGDTIKVSAVHLKEGRSTCKRKIVEINSHGQVGVRLFGWNPFWLRNNEIIEKI